MKSFLQYITELFDAPVKVKKIPNGTSHRHDYTFKVNNIPYHVSIHHLFADKGKADVDFGDKSEKPEDSMTTTGKQGTNASAVFAGVHKALKMHQAENPHIDTYTFDASNEKSGDVNPGRTRLYGAIVRKHGGKQFGNSFKIPAESLREENEKVLKIRLRGGANTARKSDDFLDEYHASTHEHPFDSRSRVHDEGATTELSRDGGSGIHMHDIRSLTPGGGTKTLETLKALADKHGVTISGTAKAYSQSSKYPMDTKKLAGWYKKRGFSVGDGDKHDGYEVSYSPKSIKEEAEDDYQPQKTVKAYKLFKTKANHPGKIFPLFVDNDKEVPMGKWVKATAGQPGKKAGKVKSKLGDLAYRPGWHSGDVPVAHHIGGRSHGDAKKPPDYRKSDEVWAEVEHPADHDWQSVANQRAQKNKKGQVKASTAHITDQVPYGGHYRYKTNPNMTGNWIISGNMKVNRILSDDEVKSINNKAGVADLPRMPDFEKAQKEAKKKKPNTPKL
jgi:hypothetical protein